MIEPQVEQGGASSWFWIAANLELVPAGFAAAWPAAPAG
jgi:hypothetical protein